MRRECRGLTPLLLGGSLREGGIQNTLGHHSRSRHWGRPSALCQPGTAALGGRGSPVAWAPPAQMCSCRSRMVRMMAPWGWDDMHRQSCCRQTTCCLHGQRISITADSEFTCCHHIIAATCSGRSFVAYFGWCALPKVLSAHNMSSAGPRRM